MCCGNNNSCLWIILILILLFCCGGWGNCGCENNNNGCGCTPNQSIKCTVTNCAHHCQDQNYCGLNAITVGTHETNPTKVECTDCQSFQMK